MLRIATTISLLLSCIALAAAVGSAADPASIACGLGWVVAWALACAAPHRLAIIVARRPRLAAATPITALLITIVVTGGTASHAADNLNWFSWVYLVAATPAAACAVAGCTSLALLVAFSITSPAWISEVAEGDQLLAVTTTLNPLVAAATGVILIAVFRRVLRQADDAGAEISTSGWAATPALAELIRGTARAELPVRGLSATDHARAALRQSEREVVDLLAAGRTPQQIAFMQDRSPDSVYRTIDAAKRRTGSRTVEQLVAVAWAPSL